MTRWTVIQHLAQWRAKRQGLKRVNRWGYLPRMLIVFCQYDYPMIHLNADGCEYRGAHVLVFNLPQYGMTLDNFAPPGAIDDGLLDWIILQRRGRTKIRNRHTTQPTPRPTRCNPRPGTKPKHPLHPQPCPRPTQWRPPRQNTYTHPNPPQSPPRYSYPTITSPTQAGPQRPPRGHAAPGIPNPIN
jgi:hypothetical protein